ncbi:hypothetical protein [Saccharospirillum mangrovi]|uniref:hypothetical protein n=1 Tax=Saccharospirillum mangrovi TaxID=2161747 RepID=UPI000D3DC578|nr:hypothetical protein [Saccharospirillum mangrovi]
MKCLCCDTEIELPGKRKGLFIRPSKVPIECPVCQSSYRNNQLPVLIGNLVMIWVALIVGLVYQRFLLGLGLGLLLMLVIVDPWLRRKPLVLVHPTRPVIRQSAALNSAWLPLPILLIGLVVVWYFMFLR